MKISQLHQLTASKGNRNVHNELGCARNEVFLFHCMYIVFFFLLDR
jgi:hypothetical protein